MIEKEQDSIASFFERLNEISWENEFESETENKQFNIFHVLGIENKEVLACRFLGELLDPNGSHGLNELPLKLFMDVVLGIKEIETNDLKNANVILEDVIDNNRRVDIVIKIKDNTYPIEVKINAGDQNAQLQDYHKYYFNGQKEKKIYYLTPTGWMPSKSSIGQLDEESVVCLSFENKNSRIKSIQNWLDTLNKETTNGFINAIIGQYIEVIKEMSEEIDMKTILDEIGIGENLDFPSDCEKRKKLFGLIKVLAANGDRNGTLQKKIQQAYLKKFLNFDNNNEKYEIQSKVDIKEHKYAVLSICRKKDVNDPIAWICIDTNLYIECKKRNAESRIWHENDNWAYIHPQRYKKGNENRFQLDNCLNIIKYSDIENNKINICDLLNSIKA